MAALLLDDPRQWIEVKKEPDRIRPWVLIVAGYIRAECTTKVEADMIRMKMINAFGATVSESEGKKP